MIKLEELRSEFKRGNIDKRLYWQIVRENYTRILPQLTKLIKENSEVISVELRKDGVILKKASGILLFFDFKQFFCRAEVQLLMEGDPEKDDMVFISNYLNNYEDSTMLDIGANVGIFSLDFYKRHRGIKYYLFEPIPDTFLGLQKNAKLNLVDEENYMPFNIGMSDEKESFNFYVPSSNEAASMVANEDVFYRKRATEDGDLTGSNEIDKIECKVETVDDFVKEHSVRNISFIKIDVEGNELKVLKGAAKTILENKPLIYCELLRKHAKRFGYHPNDVIKLMHGYGYVCKTMRNGKLEMINEVTEDTVETNFFFLIE